MSVCRVQQILSSDEFLEYSKLMKAPKLTPFHKAKRVEWARERIGLPASYCHNVIFSDEKRFSLDGPDGASYYWADKRLPKRIFSTRQQGCGSVMVWAGVSARGATDIIFVEETMI